MVDELAGQIYQQLAGQRSTSWGSQDTPLALMPRVGQSLPAYPYSVLKQLWQQFTVALGLNFMGSNDPVPIHLEFAAGPEEWWRLKTLLKSIKCGEKGPIERMTVEQLQVQEEDGDLFIMAPYFVLDPDGKAAASLPPAPAPPNGEPPADLEAAMKKVVASFENL